jgi:CHAT domain-containing protein
MCQLSGAGAKDVDAEAIARTVGQWGKISGSFSFTLGLGILLNRFSRHWMIRRGHYERALACSRAARTLFGALGAKVNVAQCEFDQGSIYQAVGERKSAATLYERALDDYTDAIKAYPLVASNLRQRAVSLAMSLHGLYQQQSDGEGMERIAGRLRHITEELPAGKPNLEEALADFVSKLSVTASGAPLESPAEMVAEAAERATLQAVRQAAERVIEQSSALAPLERWRKARDEGNESLARSFLDRALAAARKIPDDSRHALEATVLQARKDYKQAAEAYRRHLAAGGANAGLAGDIAGVMQQFGGEDGQHVASLQQQRTHLSAFMFFVNVRHYDEARTHLVELERITGKGWWENDQQPWVPLIKCAEMYEGLDDPDRQMECYDRAIEQLEARRDGLTLDELKVSLASEEGAQYLYFRAARAAIRAGGGARAFDYAERGKARALLDQMASARSESSLNESLQARKWRRINSQLFDQRRLLARVREAQGSPETGACIDPFERRIAELQSELRTVERDLARTNPNFHEAINPRAGTMSFDEVRAALPRGTAMIKHFFLEGDLLAWAITRDGRAKTYRAQIDANALSRTIRDFHRACESRGNYERLAENLSDLLLGPFAETIRASERLIFVPYGAAHTLPFHVLPFDGQPLGASYSISFLPSASAMRFLKKNEADTLPKKILVVGNPTGDLPFAETEAEFVAGLFERSELLAGGEATEAAVRERIGKYPLLHFATHGNLSESSPLDSSIALAGGERLTVLGLMDLRLRARLVVLSACSTAKGETTGGDDVLGLTRGLLAAGARSAIVSLWPVNDHSTAIFMTEFYRHLQTGDAPDDALRKARNHLRHLTDKGIVESLRGARAFQFGPKSHARRLSGYGHPYYWAPFILVG